eukprot:TRINITY_DN16252_c0_g3_i1.p2 TRINITY_DN16252_c0_g3~~TRINITY_DN16252_c0_g3_i1.p2  ORF type:complete len:376 (+),score=36.33 TRINITY_DN16252_c0_g3_i1:101-1228(+)
MGGQHSRGQRAVERLVQREVQRRRASGRGRRAGSGAPPQRPPPPPQRTEFEDALPFLPTESPLPREDSPTAAEGPAPAPDTPTALGGEDGITSPPPTHRCRSPTWPARSPSAASPRSPPAAGGATPALAAPVLPPPRGALRRPPLPPPVAEGAPRGPKPPRQGVARWAAGRVRRGLLLLREVVPRPPDERRPRDRRGGGSPRTRSAQPAAAAAAPGPPQPPAAAPRRVRFNPIAPVRFYEVDEPGQWRPSQMHRHGARVTEVAPRTQPPSPPAPSRTQRTTQCTPPPSPPAPALPAAAQRPADHHAPGPVLPAARRTAARGGPAADRGARRLPRWCTPAGIRALLPVPRPRPLLPAALRRGRGRRADGTTPPAGA